MNKQEEMTFAKELWKIILEIEDMVRTYYQRHAEEEIYNLQDDVDPSPPF